VQDGAKALAAAGATVGPNFDEQEAVVGRLSWLPINQADAHWLIGVNGTYVIKPPDLVANGLATLNTSPTATAYRNTITLSDPPELTFDSNGYSLVNSGALPASHISQWGVETAGNWGSLYGQAGYYSFTVDRAAQAVTQFTAPGVSAPTILHPSNDNFSGWYLQGSWLLTGEERPYNVSTGSFTAPKVAEPLNFNRGTWGAFELALRYSELDLNDHELDSSSVVTGYSGVNPTYTFYNTVRGGDQRIATVGLNWYPNSVVRFALNYELIQNSRLQSPTAVTTAATPILPTVNGGQNLSAVALRAQLAL
jgi:phosphate-selective porin OprO/OprP